MSPNEKADLVFRDYRSLHSYSFSSPGGELRDRKVIGMGYFVIGRLEMPSLGDYTLQ
jgi:hypothetical protein